MPRTIATARKIRIGRYSRIMSSKGKLLLRMRRATRHVSQSAPLALLGLLRCPVRVNRARYFCINPFYCPVPPCPRGINPLMNRSCLRRGASCASALVRHVASCPMFRFTLTPGEYLLISTSVSYRPFNPDYVHRVGKDIATPLSGAFVNHGVISVYLCGSMSLCIH